MTTDMIKTEITYKDGNQYVLDADFNNGSIITLVSHGNIYGRVKSEDSEWETMLNRLTEIPQWAKQYFQFTQPPTSHTVTAWVDEKEEIVSTIASALYNIRNSKQQPMLDTGKCDELAEFIYIDLSHWLEQVQLPIQGYSLEGLNEIEKLLTDFFLGVRKHINGHNTLIGKFTEAMQKLQSLKQQEG